MVMENPQRPGDNFGYGSREDIARYYETNLGLATQNAAFGRHLENLKFYDIRRLEQGERLQTVEMLRSTQVDPQITFHNILQHNIETYRYKTEFYSFQNQVAMAQRQQEMFESAQMGVREGLVGNERLLGLQTVELIRHKSALNIAEWALPYKATYYGGMDSMGLLPQRGGQLFLGDMSRTLQGTRSAWLNEEPEELTTDEYPEQVVAQRRQEIEAWRAAKEQLPMVENGETLTDRYGRYLADTDYWLRAIGEMNTYNTTIPGETIALTETTQQFLGELMQRRTRTYEDGNVEEIGAPTRRIQVYLNAQGEQIPFQVDANGNQIRPAGAIHEERSQFIEVLDPYNKARSETEMKYVICAISAMAIHRAKEVLDDLPADYANARSARATDQSTQTIYQELYRKVHQTAMDMMKNFDAPPKRNFEYMLARSAYYLADSLAFGSFDIAERGGSYSWELQKKGNGFIWKTEPSQGDPTASGDAFSALKPYFHEAVYQAVKSRISSFGEGLNVPINAADGDKMAEIFMSRAAELNDRKKTIEMVARGQQHQYLAVYFGIMGAFKSELGHLPAYRQGEEKRRSFGKKVNPNFSKAVEEYVVFVPTPFDFAHVTNDAVADYAKDMGMTHGEKVIYPMLNPQQKVGLYDMLSSGKEYSVGDMLRRTWKKDANGIWRETPPDRGGRRLTIRDIDWEQYARYAEDGRAVNNNFMLQLYAPVYGALNPKTLEQVQANPKAAISASTKAADIGFRWVFKRFENPTPQSGERVKRPSLEILHGSPVAFQQLALGVHGLVGRNAATNFSDFVTKITPGEEKKTNIYMVLRAAEDMLPVKQGYADYSDTWCVSFIAQTEAMKPVALASNEMAWETTKRFDLADPTERSEWKTLVQKESQKKTPLPPLL